MLQAHSLLWNYLWVAPNVLLLLLGFFIWKRGLAGQYPAFLAFAILSALGDLAVFTADVARSVPAISFWRIALGGVLLESLLKFVVIGEVFSRTLNPYPAVAHLGRTLISGFGAALVLVATLFAAFSKGDSTVRLISGVHLLEQTVFLIELGLILFLFLFAAYFRLTMDRLSFGILLGFGISTCEYLATWAIMTNGDLSTNGRTLLDFLNMATYHLCVLIWGYYLFVPGRVTVRSSVALPENNLALWNRELERLLQ